MCLNPSHFCHWTHFFILDWLDKLLVKWCLNGRPQRKSLSAIYAQFSGTGKQVIVDLESIEDEEHLVVELEKDKEVKKKGVKQAPQRRPWRRNKGRREEFVLLWVWWHLPCELTISDKGGSNCKEKGVISNHTIIVQKIDKVEEDGHHHRWEAWQARAIMFGHEGLNTRYEGCHGGNDNYSIQGGWISKPQ